MKLKKNEFKKPLAGVGLVKLGKSSFTVELTYKNESWKDETDTFQFKNDAIPESLQDVFGLKNNKSYFFNIRADGSAINDIRPAKGMFKAKCLGLHTNDDGEFVVIEKSGTYGKYWKFIADLQITSGEYKGIIFPLYLPLGSEDPKSGEINSKFRADDDGYIDLYGDPDKSMPFKMLLKFMICTGLMATNIRYPEDDEMQSVLKAISKTIKKQDKSFSMSVAEGYPDALSELDEDEDTEVSQEDDDEDDVPVKKVSKVVEDDDDDKPVKKSSKAKFEEDED